MKLPADWQAFLMRLQSQFPEAVIAGGALRDLILQRDIRDIDIFVQSRGKMTEPMINMALGTFVQPMNPEWVKDYEEHLPELFAVYELGGYDEESRPFQIIALNMEVTPKSVIDRIDFGICRVAHDGEVFIITREFTKDAEQQTFTLVHTNNRQSSQKRFYRLTEEKYLGYGAVDLWEPKRFEELFI